MCPLFLGGAPATICHFFCLSVCLSVHLSVCPSVLHHISRTVHYLILIFGTNVQNDDISTGTFFIFLKFWFLGLLRGRVKNSPKWKVKITSVTGTIKHMIMIFGIVLQNDDISSHFFHFFKILIFWVVKRGKRTKNGPKWERILSVALHILETIHYMTVHYYQLHSISQDPYIWWSFVVHECKVMISPGIFFIFSNFDFEIVSGVKGQKMIQNDKKLCLSHPISQELCILSHVKKDNILQVFFTFLNFLHFLLAHLNRFLVNSCFSSSSISAKQQFWSVPHLHFTKTKLFRNYEKCFLFHLKSLFPSRDIHFFTSSSLFSLSVITPQDDWRQTLKFMMLSCV